MNRYRLGMPDQNVRRELHALGCTADEAQRLLELCGPNVVLPEART
jgi:hypothetical protein